MSFVIGTMSHPCTAYRRSVAPQRSASQVSSLQGAGRPLQAPGVRWSRGSAADGGPMRMGAARQGGAGRGRGRGRREAGWQPTSARDHRPARGSSAESAFA